MYVQLMAVVRVVNQVRNHFSIQNQLSKLIYVMNIIVLYRIYA